MKRVIMSVLLASLIAPIAFAEPVSEPNDPNDQLKFERDNDYVGWVIAGGKNEKGELLLYDDPGPVKPPYVAQVILRRDRPNHTSALGVLRRIKDSPISRHFSKAQQEFLKTDFAVWADADSSHILNHFATWLYAMTEEDARIMALSYLDGLQGLVDEQMDVYHRVLAENQQELQEAEKVLPDKRKQMEALSDEYQKVREALHKFDGHASDAAKQTISEMDKMLDSLEIEMIGIREKLKTIEKFRKREDDAGPLATQVYYKLDEMYVELMIELSGVEARMQMAEHIRDRERGFVDLQARAYSADDEVANLEKTIDRSQRGIEEVTERLANPSGNMLPPKVYQNKVLIHRIADSVAPEDFEEYVAKIEKKLVESSPPRVDIRRELRETEKALEMVDSGKIRLGPSFVKRLKALQQQLQELKVDEFLRELEREHLTDDAFRRRSNIYYGYLRDAKRFLEEIDESRLYATPSQVQRLKDFIKAFEQFQERRVEQLLEDVEVVNWDAIAVKYRGQSVLPGQYRQHCTDAKFFLSDLGRERYPVTPAQAQRLKDFIEKYEQLQEKLEEQE